MRRTVVTAGLWAGFTILMLSGGYATLRACDLGIAPLFGASACAAPPADASVTAERERQDKLRTELHSAELRLAQLPICKPPPLKPEPKPIVEKPPEPKPPVEPFRVPDKIEDLKGCWQSARGDIEMISDDAERKHVGNARFCYCFKSNGRGAVQVRYTDGDTCRAPLIAKIRAGKVFMHHDKVPCRKRSNVNGEDITCGNDESNGTTCEMEVLGQHREKLTEKFIRVTEEYCGFRG